MEGMTERYPGSLTSHERGGRAESFDDLKISLGDYLEPETEQVSTSTSTREVVDILRDPNLPGGGKVRVQLRAAHEHPDYQELSFSDLLDQQRWFTVNKPLPAEVIRSNSLTDPKLLETIEQLNSRLLDPQTRPELRNQFELRRSRIERQITEKIIGHVQEALQPEDGDLLREFIKQELYDNAHDGKAREQAVAAHGYDGKELTRTGEAIFETLKEIYRQPDGRERYVNHIREFEPLVFKHRTRFSALTIGASATVARQARKLLRASIGSTPERVMNANNDPTFITARDVQTYLERQHRSPSAFKANQEGIIRERALLHEPSTGVQKTKQYQFAQRLLQHVTT